MTTESPYFTMYERFKRMPPGVQAPLRRVAEPEDLRDTPGLYRLFPGASPTEQQVRAAFILPWCRELSGGKKLGAVCAKGIAEARIIQIARALPPADLIALRRLVIQLQPALGWLEVAPFAWDWSQDVKRKLVEVYFIALHKLDKGATA
ncbi:MAG: CRISPR-associated protein Cse2 [Lamprocystis purpurea]|jgi:CRISPR system Cascade subunit CasB|uniref:hypothetical protein n=1 Tax=Lamprocystis purpurea TaxID=61598 RepID=UPI00036FD24E|nr:hypothetical protein [Lamprocystis purpurea]MBV5272587.1 CRISPR-associated protein Cse2 [Lamprocystis purpurea]